MTIPLENVVMLICAAQGALIGLLILQKHSALYANRFLALMMFTIGVVLVHMVLQDMDLYGPARYLMPVLLSLAFAVTPLHFLYAKFLMHRRERFRAKEAVHFIPCVVFLVLGLILAAGSSTEKNFFAEHRPVEEYPVVFLLFNWAIILQGIAYMGIVFLRIRNYERTIKNVFSSIEHRRLLWLRNITLLAASAWCSFLVEHTLLSAGINASNFMISSILIAVYLFTLGYLGMLKSEVLEAALPEAVAVDVSGEDTASAGEGSPKYEKSGLTPEAAMRYRTQILDVMEREKPYRASDLTLPQLAERVRISPHNLSEVINSQLGKTFYDLVNEYRITEVKAALADPSKKNLKIISIAFDAGFNSKASFNTLFKQHTHTTPSEFRKTTLGTTPD